MGEHDRTKPVIMHCIPALSPGGTERMLLQTIQRLPRYTHVVCCLLRGGPIAEELRTRGIVVETLHSHLPSCSAIRDVRSCVRRHMPSVMITYLPLADIIGKLVGRWEGVPVILCSLRSTLRDWRYFPLIILEVATARFASHYIAVSEAVKQRFTQWGLPVNNVTVIPNGIDLKRFTAVRSPVDRTSKREYENVHTNDILFIVIGNLRKERGHAFVLDAFARAQPNIQYRSHLWIIGDGPERSSLERRSLRLGIGNCVRFLGFRSDLPQLLPLADIAISSSLYEGMSNALLEVMATGLAIIAVDVPENRELITHGKSGILVHPRSTDALSQAATILANSPGLRGQLGAAAQQSAQRFSIERTIQELEALLRRFLSTITV